MRQADADHGRDDDLSQRTGQGNAAHGEKILEREVQADAEHQQDDADLGQLPGKRAVSDDAGA